MKTACLMVLFFPVLLFAQNGKPDISNPDRLGVKEYNLVANRAAPSSIKLPFSSIKIIDSRYDTSKIGYTDLNGPFHGKKNGFKKLQLKGGLADAVQKYYQDYYAASFDASGFSLLIVIKKFWLSSLESEKNKGIDVATNGHGAGNLYCKWEYYLGKDEKYLPVKRVDTIWSHDENLSRYIQEEFDEKGQQFIKFSLKAQIEMLDFSRGIEAFDRQNKKTIGDIIAFNESRFNLPILKANSFSQGVFVNFQEFVNNKPSIPGFKEQKTRYDLIRNENYLEDDKGNTINPYWGYYDGANLKYGKFGNDKLYRIGNTFGLFVKLVWYTDDTSYGDMTMTTRNRHELWIPYQVDMDTGDVY